MTDFIWIMVSPAGIIDIVVAVGVDVARRDGTISIDADTHVPARRAKFDSFIWAMISPAGILIYIVAVAEDATNRKNVVRIDVAVDVRKESNI